MVCCVPCILMCYNIHIMTNETSVKKVAVVGAGAVGSTISYALLIKNLVAEIFLIDVNVDKEHGEVLDLGDAISFTETGNILNGTYADARTADIVILTAGAAQKPDETRLDLVTKNKAITTSIIKEIGGFKPNAIVLVVSNPVDIITNLVQELSGLPHTQVFGTGTCLDTARLRTNLGHRFDIDAKQVEGFVMGEHGDGEQVAWSTVSVAGKPISEMLSADEMATITGEVKNEVYEIIKEKGATFYGIGMVVTDIVEAILLDQNKVLPISYRLENYNGVDAICMGAPAVVGAVGVVKPWPVELTQTEKDLFINSAETIKKYL